MWPTHQAPRGARLCSFACMTRQPIAQRPPRKPKGRWHIREPLYRVLVVNHEPHIRRYLRTSLRAQGYRVLEAATGQEAIARMTAKRPHVVLLDLDLPDLEGLEVLRRLRDACTVPIIVVSDRERAREKIAALDGGADDYVAMPFSLDELLARIRVVLRRQLQAVVDEPVFRSGRLTVDLAKRVVRVDGRRVTLTPTEYEMLHLFIIHAGKVLTHRQLLHQVRGSAAVDDIHYLRVYVSQLR
jgi:two-component system, OmpR family, KDP operon response regulator KdpE